MVLMFEFAPPFRWRMKVERHGPLTRIIFAWFSVSYIGAGVNQMAQAFRMNEREACAKLCETNDLSWVDHEWNNAVADCARKIRARGEQAKEK